MSSPFISHAASDLATAELNAGRHVMLVGRQGSGKTRYAHAYAPTVDPARETTGYDPARPKNLNIIDCDAHLEVDDVYGTFKPSDTGGFVWTEGALPDAARHGKILLINEFTTLKAAVQHVFHSAADGSPIAVRTRSGTELIYPHKDFRIIVTMNGSAFAGNYRVSLATVDRFTIIQWPYLSIDAEVGLLHGIAPEHGGTLRDLVEAANETRADIDKFPPIGTRALEVVAQMLDDGMGTERAVFHKLMLPVKITAPQEYPAFKTFILGKIAGLDPALIDAYDRGEA